MKTHNRLFFRGVWYLVFGLAFTSVFLPGFPIKMYAACFFSFIFPVDSLKCNLKDLNTGLYISVVPGNIDASSWCSYIHTPIRFRYNVALSWRKVISLLPKCDYFQWIACRELTELWLVDCGRGRNTQCYSHPPKLRRRWFWDSRR